jgi:hypothetical protein
MNQNLSTRPEKKRMTALEERTELHFYERDSCKAQQISLKKPEFQPNTLHAESLAARTNHRYSTNNS